MSRLTSLADGSPGEEPGSVGGMESAAALVKAGRGPKVGLVCVAVKCAAFSHREYWRRAVIQSLIFGSIVGAEAAASQVRARRECTVAERGAEACMMWMTAGEEKVGAGSSDHPVSLSPH